MQTCLYYDQVIWIPISCAIKSSQEIHCHTMSAILSVSQLNNIIYLRTVMMELSCSFWGWGGCWRRSIWYTPPRITYLRRLSSCGFSSIWYFNFTAACLSSAGRSVNCPYCH